MNGTGSRSDNRTLRRLGITALIIVCAVLVMNEVFGAHGLLALRRQRREYDSLQQQVRELELKNLQLEKDIKELKSNPQAIEKQAREELHLARPGEIIYTLPDKSPKSSAPAAQNAPAKP